MKPTHAVMALLLTGAAGCASLRTVQEPAQFIQREQPAEVYVTFLNHSQVTMMQPQVRGDSLVGRIAGVSHVVAAPLTDVERIDARQRDQGRTRWLIAGLGVVTAGLVFGMMQSGSNDWRHPCETEGSNECDKRLYY